jgi:lipopolysaccharide transport system ATP-binding protein
MNGIAIKVENLSKQYRIGAREGYMTFRETLVDAVKAPLQGLRGLFARHSSLVTRDSQTIWALKDVSFEVRQGEVVGIIGRNGAGKSTLLKILSRITEPTEGRVELRGRVGSLLEVGTGFHPELTGHENIYLYGAILGMDRWEVTRKFDEIVAFAELEKFIDTPVKKYSSGMYMRLAFAVAAHLEPEILLVDEVLAVGDAAFQKKCLGKMGDLAKQRRTVLFVSHNMGAISVLCSKGVLLRKGEVERQGSVDNVVTHYLSEGAKVRGKAILPSERQRLSDDFMFCSIQVRKPQGNVTAQADLLQGCDLDIDYEVIKPIRNVILGFRLWTSNGLCVLTSTDADNEPSRFTTERRPGRYRSSCHLASQFLRPGRYVLDIAASVPNVRMLDEIPGVLTFEVVDTGSLDAKLSLGRQGVIAPVLEWTVGEIHRGSVVDATGEDELKAGGTATKGCK